MFEFIIARLKCMREGDRGREAEGEAERQRGRDTERDRDSSPPPLDCGYFVSV